MAQALFAIQAVSQVSQGYSDFESSKMEERNQRTTADINSRFMRLKADDAITRGQQDVNKINRETTRLKGQQRAAYAGQGVQVDTGSAGQVAAETDLTGKVDALTTQNNAWKEAWGLRSEADNLQAEARAKSNVAKQQRFQTIATTGLKLGQTGMQSYGAKRGGRTYVPRNATEDRYNNEYRSGR